MIINIASHNLSIGLIWQEMTTRSDFVSFTKTLRVTDALFLKRDGLAAAGTQEDRSAYALCPMIARAIGNGLAVVHIDRIKDDRCYILVAARDGIFLPTVKLDGEPTSCDSLLTKAQVLSLSKKFDGKCYFLGKDNEGFEKFEQQDLETLVKTHLDRAFLIKKASSKKPLILVLLLVTLGLSASLYYYLLSSPSNMGESERAAIANIRAHKSHQQDLMAHKRASFVIARLMDIEQQLPMFTSGFGFKGLNWEASATDLLVTYELSPHSNISFLHDLVNSLKLKGFGIGFERTLNNNTQVSVLLKLPDVKAPQYKPQKSAPIYDFVGALQALRLHFMLGKSILQQNLSVSTINIQDVSPIELAQLQALGIEYPAFLMSPSGI